MIGISTVFNFLGFSQEAIQRIAFSRSATWLGLLFVIAAGFAREYDGEYLIAEPWHVLIPVAASLLGCSIMFLFVHSISLWYRNNEVPSVVAFRCLLNVYWMTAPMALLYAIPFERFLSPGAATKSNLILLAIVAAWRVFLMIRCVQVLYKVDWYRALFPVILFSDLLAMLAIWLVPGPIFMIMGGVRLTESENIILSVRIWLILFGYGTALIWIIGYCALGFRSSAWRLMFVDKEQIGNPVKKPAWAFAILSILIWLPILFLTQPEQALRWRAENYARDGKFELLSEFSRDNDIAKFPPHWDPPPRIGYGENTPNALVTLVELTRHGGADWITNRYFEKLSNDFLDSLSRLSNDELKNLIEGLETQKRGPEVATIFETWLSIQLRNRTDESNPETELYERLYRLIPEQHQEQGLLSNSRQNVETEN